MGSMTLKLATALLFIGGLIGVSFGVWGVYTPQGRSNYDEMDGIYPLLAGFTGAVFMAIALVGTLITLVRARRS